MTTVVAVVVNILWWAGIAIALLVLFGQARLWWWRRGGSR